MRSHRGPFLLLLILLLVQSCVFLFSKWPGEWQGDEKHYVQSASNLIRDNSKQIQTYTWRFPGYPYFVALCNVGNEGPENIRYRCAIVQFLLAIGAILCFYRVANQILNTSPRLYSVAFLLGAQPWVTGFVRRLLPDSLTGSLLTFGLLALFGFITIERPARSCAYFLLALLLLAATATMRPEMMLLSPLFVFVALGLKLKSKVPLKVTITAAVLIVAAAGIYTGYRLLSKGRMHAFQKYSLKKPGGLKWVQTWFATERSGFKNLLEKPFINPSTFGRIPDRAFSDSYERNEIRRALELSYQRQKFDSEVDNIFRNIAEKRKRDNFFLHSVLTKIWSTAHMWVNLETSEHWVKVIHRAGILSRPLFLFFLSLKLALFFLAILSMFQIFRYYRENKLRWYHTLTILMIFCVIARTFVIGQMVGYLHRYAVAVWPAMLWCAVSGCIDLNTERFMKIVRR